MNRNTLLRIVGVSFFIVVLCAGAAIPLANASAETPNVTANYSEVTASNLDTLQQSTPSTRPSDERSPIATYGPGDTSIDVSSQDWVYVRVEGARGGSGWSGANGGLGGVVSGWVDVSDTNTLTTVIAQQGNTNGYHDGEPGSTANREYGGDGAGSTGIAKDGTLLLEAGGGGGGGGDGSFSSSGSDGGRGGEIGTTGGSAGAGASVDSDDYEQGGDGTGYANSPVLYSDTSGTSGGDGRVEVYEPQVESAGVSNFETDGEQTFQFNVADGDLDQPWGDEVDVSVSTEGGETLLTDTVTSSSQTVSYSEELQGVTNVSVSFEDSVGITSESDPYTIYGAGTANIRNEKTNEILDSTEVTVTLFGDNGNIYTQTTTNGRIDLTSYEDQRYVVEAGASGYHSRTRIVQSPSEIGDLYLLPESAETVNTLFTLSDTTGLYSSASTLTVLRPINTSEGVQYQEIITDEFGTEGVSVTLEQEQRYRIRIQNQDNTQSQVLGPYRATASETVAVQPGTGSIAIESEGSWSAGAAINGSQLVVRYEDNDEITDSVTINIYQRGNESNQLTPPESYYDSNSLVSRYNLEPDEANKSWVVELTIERDGETFTTHYLVGSNVAGVPVQLDPFWRNVIAIMLLFSFGSIFSMYNKAAGGIALTTVAGLLFWLGWLSGVTVTSAILIYAFIAVVYAIFNREAL